MALKTKRSAAVALGRLGGRASSAAKARAARENGRKGGRPRKAARGAMSTRHRNDGIRKRCDCPRRAWAKVRAPVALQFRVGRRALPLQSRTTRPARGEGRSRQVAARSESLGKPISDKTTALKERDRLRVAIQDGTLQAQPAKRESLTLDQQLVADPTSIAM